MNKKKKLTIGLTLGAGSAKGLVHIGILKSLHQHKIYPDYIAATSMGAVVGAAYAAGRSPQDIEEMFKTTDWKNILDFTIPKAGLIRGSKVERRIDELVYHKKFHQLDIPLRLVSYDLMSREKVILHSGNVARAVRASISIPGIFTPVRLDHHYYIDGAVIDPAPVEVVKEMGADIIIAVDIYSKAKTAPGPTVRERTLLQEWKQQFVAAELTQIKRLIFPEAWPPFLRQTFIWLFDKILYPARLLRVMAGQELPVITKVMYETLNALSENLAAERLHHAQVDFKVTPVLDGLNWTDFDQVEKFVKAGEEAMDKQIPMLKKKLGR